MRTRSTGCATLVAALMTVAAIAAGTASAKVVRAEGVLPPGQSGFVSLPGLVQGTGSPHLYDQNSLYIDFKRKPLLFQIDSAPAIESPRAGVTIVRDAYGVPAVRGGSENDAWFGAGYAIAQDRLFQLEAFRHAIKGRLAELTGRRSAGLYNDAAKPATLFAVRRAEPG